jgi:phage gp45-like
MGMSPIRRAIDKALRPVRNRLRSVVQRAVLDSISDSEGVPIVQVKLIGDHVRRAESFQPAGLSSKPSAGQGVGLAINGNTDHMAVLGLYNRAHRPTDQATGDTRLYDEHGGEVDMTATGIKLHQGGATDFVALAAKVLTELNDIRTKFDAHTHVTTATIDAGPVGALAPPAPPMGAASSTAAAKVKAE